MTPKQERLRLGEYSKPTFRAIAMTARGLRVQPVDDLPIELCDLSAGFIGKTHTGRIAAAVSS
jgi:hypothetical protein